MQKFQVDKMIFIYEQTEIHSSTYTHKSIVLFESQTEYMNSRNLWIEI